MPPEKKKKLNQQTLSDDAEEAAVVKNVKKGDSSTRLELSPDAKEAIRFDEYMEGGIPDSLLKGLGFSESGHPGADESSEPEVEPESTDAVLPSKDSTAAESEEEEEAIANDDDGYDDDDGEAEKTPKQTIVKRKRGRPPGKTSSKWADYSKQAFPSYKSVRSNPRAVIRGNIMYERTETGEVVASLLRNGPKGTEAGKSSPGRPKHARNVPSTLVLSELPSNCPIDENNVEDILDRSIEETNAMRMMLATLKDDLRRMGGGPSMTQHLKPVHVKKRIEIAERLLKVYCDYQTNINNISEMGHNPLSHVFPGNWTPTERPQPAVHAPRRGRGGKSVEGETLARKMNLQAAMEMALPAVVKQEPGIDAGAVSNDLWMSCEPGSDDDGIGVMGMRKAKKQLRQKVAAVTQSN